MSSQLLFARGVVVVATAGGTRTEARRGEYGALNSMSLDTIKTFQNFIAG